MKKASLAMASVCFVIVAMVILRAQNTTQGQAVTVSGLPASLNTFYPPESQAPVYLIEMHKLSQPLSGIMCDLFEADMENVRHNYEAFKQQYSKMAGMVPEWSHLYPSEPVDRLGQAVSTGNQQEILAAAGQVGQVCDQCHHLNMPATQHAFHWGDFSGITATDPLTNTEVPFKQLMLMMESSMTGTGIDLQQGQLDNARRQLARFEARFLAVSQTCSACHDTERKYFVDEEITSTIDRLKEVLSQEQPDPQPAGGLLQQIARESCSKCHLVHIPAAYAQVRPVGL